ncbi:MAG: ABC transporter ATP-binding protein [Ilumatobacteraceae bacterium]|nr:ABC transporter ATP-binding protein [Ilumatobacteraceae bacterium]
MTNVGVPMERSKDFGTTSRRLMRRMSQENVLVMLVLVLAVTSVTLVVLGPRILGHATDVVFDGLLRRNGVDGIDFAKLHNILGLALLLYVLSFCLAYLQSFIMSGVVQRTMYQLRQDVEAKLHRLPLSYVDKNSRGDLLSRVTNDIDNIAQSLQQSLSGLLTSLLTIVGVIVMMFLISPVLALIAMLMVPSSLITMKYIATRSRKRFIAQWTHTGKLNGLVEEAFTGHAIVKAFGRQGEVEDRFAIINEELHHASFGAQFMSGAIQPAMMFIGNLNYVTIAVVGGVRVASGSLGLGDIQAFIQYSRLFTAPLTQTASMMNVLQSGIASAERVFELLDAQEQSPDVDSRVDDTLVNGRVEFVKVGFSYNKETPLIEDLSLVAEPGTTVAIVGATGAGKTTLVNLLMRFYELDNGYITLDGYDIAMIPRRDLRSKIGMVLQDTWLFGGTIRENIAYGNPAASEEQIMAVAKATYVDRFVHSLPDGYDTILSDEGGSVSAGEKQLLTIARAFLADPIILILDEATSSVDTRTEVLIQKAMSALRSKRTSFVIAHRLSTIRDADVILMMEKGRIVEQGSHHVLLARKGPYYELYQSQFSAPAEEIM